MVAFMAMSRHHVFKQAQEHIGDPPRGGDVGVASLRSIITKGCASWYPCDARPRISGMILLELPILGPVDLSSL